MPFLDSSRNEILRGIAIPISMHVKGISLERFINDCTRDGNSSENFIPQGIEESRNGKFTFLGDRGR